VSAAALVHGQRVDLQGDIKRRIKELSEEIERPARGGELHA
jgi:hypothetical protein